MFWNRRKRRMADILADCLEADGDSIRLQTILQAAPDERGELQRLVEVVSLIRRSALQARLISAFWPHVTPQLVTPPRDEARLRLPISGIGALSSAIACWLASAPSYALPPPLVLAVLAGMACWLVWWLECFYAGRFSRLCKGH